jgi:HPt (histidine-containing phosphotransfer) domain-containing protein
MHLETTTAEYVYSIHAGDTRYADRIARFAAEMPERIDDLLSATRAEVWPEVVRQAQLLKLAATSLGFVAVAVAAADVEQTIGMNRPETLVHQAVNELLSVCGRVRHTFG